MEEHDPDKELRRVELLHHSDRNHHDEQKECHADLGQPRELLSVEGQGAIVDDHCCVLLSSALAAASLSVPLSFAVFLSHLLLPTSLLLPVVYERLPADLADDCTSLLAIPVHASHGWRESYQHCSGRHKEKEDMNGQRQGDKRKMAQESDAHQRMDDRTEVDEMVYECPSLCALDSVEMMAAVVVDGECVAAVALAVVGEREGVCSDAEVEAVVAAVAAVVVVVTAVSLLPPGWTQGFALRISPDSVLSPWDPNE